MNSIMGFLIIMALHSVTCMSKNSICAETVTFKSRIFLFLTDLFRHLEVVVQRDIKRRSQIKRIGLISFEDAT